MTALGISLLTLSAKAPEVRTTYPAKVVMPPNAEQVISSPVPGLLTQIAVQPGQAVEAGTALLVIASSEYGQLQLDMIQAAARASLARQNAQRERSLFSEGIIPERRVQEAQATLREADAAIRQARAALRLAGMSDADVDRLLKSGVPESSVTVRAGRKGVVNALLARNGQRVDAATALAEISSTDTLWLEIQVPAGALVDWAEGAQVSVQGREVAARLITSATTVDAASQTVTIRAAIERSATPLRPGEVLSAELAAGQGPQGWSVPLSAIAHDGKQAYVFVRTGQGFDARPVRLLASAGAVARVAGELAEGEQIATSSVVALKGAWLKSGEEE
ncbi:membrane fusion protein silB [Bordetella ansorpii]|uniref:Membrane fusion protein silB n=2 Tax=Bordetella ansorpii TaxID=288768 RepID=A0A157S519_9BORD|nr:membrane fusion protein silB [Bordetella ansorpii]